METKGKLLLLFAILLIIISFATNYQGHTDIREYAGVAKFFSGQYKADIRASHSMLYSFLHFPLIMLFKTIFIMKLISLIFLIAIAISIYYIGKKDKRALLLVVVSPIIWYSSPWITPISIASFFFLWGYFFLNKYNGENKLTNLIFSGLLFGLSWAFWNTTLYVLIILAVIYFINKKLAHFFLFLIAVVLGLMPLLIFDQIFYGLFFYSILRHFFGVITSVIYGSIYSGVDISGGSILSKITFLLMTPVLFYSLFKKQFFKEHKKEIIFLILAFLFFLIGNSQIRYILFFWPPLILLLSKSLNKNQFKIQLILFFIISLIVISPYLVQIKYKTNTQEFYSVLANFPNYKIREDKNNLILQDLNQITKEYPNEVFVVGNKPDDYDILAFLYWQDDVKEFVSIQDYNLYFENNSILFEKRIYSKPKIQDRRQIWIGGGLIKSEADATDYNAIKLGIGLDEPLNLDNFELVKKYRILYLHRKR